MTRTKFFVQLGLAAALALTTPAFAQKGSSGPSKPEDTPKVDDRGGATTPAPAPSAPAPADDKGVDPATKVDDKGVDPAGKIDDKGVHAPGTDDKGVHAPGTDDKGVHAPGTDDRGVHAPGTDDKGMDTHMTSAPDGDRVRARGEVEIEVEKEIEHGVERQKERLKVKVEAEVNNGTAFIVWVNGQPAGAIVMRDARGEIQIENEPGKAQPAGVFPVREIKNVSVLNSIGALVLRKDF